MFLFGRPPWTSFPPQPVRHLPTIPARSAQLLRPCDVLRFPFLETDAWVSIWMTNHVSYFSYRKSRSARITTKATQWHETKHEFHFENYRLMAVDADD
jgi:hypothetical protein